ncbi:RHS repeat-associated core domain-containing protein [Kaistella sp. DKR-2]|uniref:DUF6443 domain-containing protein n=1 Tax=Kaistella soli TaxID=2849654 RepID=UPI001C27CCEF|nr:DUF6443 domain-containing protein [Kaistella soli]MBU8883505.1 RHS repeat-associated core domain-containing protein [Kaistella soli]
MKKLYRTKVIFTAFLIFLMCGILPAQPTPTENYIYTKSYLSTSGDTNPKLPIIGVQYFDGIGRPKQIVNVKASYSGKDIVTPIIYDDFGRQKLDYLPIPQLGSKDGGIYPQNSKSDPIVAFPVPDSQNVYKGEKIYSEKFFENSPLNRISQKINVGTSWSQNSINFGFLTNGELEVRRYVAKFYYGSGTLFGYVDGYFAPNQLYKNSIMDEDGNEVFEYKNEQGQIILVRKMISGTEKADTYYVYNEYNQLSFVVPPLAAVAATISDSSVLNNLCYQYKYDGRGRLVEKKLPGKGWEHMLYDQQDRLVGTQDANLRLADQWLFTKYDQFGRVVYTGLHNDPSDRATLQSSLDSNNSNAKNSESRSTARIANSGIALYYTNTAFPIINAATKLLSVNYYDSYPVGSPLFDNILAQVPAPKLLTENYTTYGNSVRSTKGLPTASFVNNIEANRWTKNYTFYDIEARPIGVYSFNYLGGYTKTESELDFVGVPQKTFTYHKRLDSDAEIKVKERFVYNQYTNALEKHYHQVNTQPEELLANNTYNEIGQLTNKKVGNNIQSIDYAYNIRGWMTGINLDSSGNFQTGKLFNYKINYNNTLQGLANPDPDFSTAIKPRYNGNIAEVLWQKDGDTHINRYGYVYDGLNRLLAGLYQSDLTQTSKEHSERLTYDLNGNIITLKRSAYFMGTAADLIDDLTYKGYVGNKFTSIIDDSHDSNGYEGGGSPINYDNNGNMTDMPDKGIMAIAYNHLNLPKQCDINPDSNTTTLIKTGYRADGVKIKKENITTIGGIRGDLTTVNTTDYLDGFQYLESRKPSDGGGSQGLMGELETEVAMEREAFSPESRAVIAPPGGGSTDNAILQFVPTAEGFYDFVENKYIYQYKDHLGNTRVSYAWNTTTNSIDVLDKNDYYPFGMNHLDPLAGSSFGQGNYKNYKYNGKELQETGMYDYGWRSYMPDTGRWMQLDPLVEDTEDPYAYVYNNPIKLNDPDGRAPEDGVEDGCCSGLKGFGLAVIDNITGGNLAQRYNDGSVSYNNGVQSGNVASAVSGAILTADGTRNITAGGVGLVASAAVSTTGGGTVIGGPGAAVSGSLILKGTAEVIVGASLMSNASKNMQSNKNSSTSSNKSNNSSNNNSKLSKVEKSTTTTTIGKEGKYTKTTEVRPGKGPGQSRAEYIRYKNQDGKVIKNVKDSYDRANKIQHRKPKELPN